MQQNYKKSYFHVLGVNSLFDKLMYLKLYYKKNIIKTLSLNIATTSCFNYTKRVHLRAQSTKVFDKKVMFDKILEKKKKKKKELCVYLTWSVSFKVHCRERDRSRLCVIRQVCTSVAQLPLCNWLKIQLAYHCKRRQYFSARSTACFFFFIIIVVVVEKNSLAAHTRTHCAVHVTSQLLFINCSARC